MPKQQKQRAHKVSSGNGIKHRRSPQTEVQKVILGGGMLVGVNKRWKPAKGD